jgi:hypothetical protein
MKTCKIVLRQGEAGLYRVERFTNTVELEVGMMVPRDKVREWTTLSRVQVEIVGMVDDEAEDERLLGDNDSHQFKIALG